MRISLQRVHLMPAEIQPDILYVSDDFEIAIHLCACGCGSKVKTPLGPTEWTVTETPSGPTMHPSIGNWQQACQSHYVIEAGQIRWAGKWSPEQIVAGRKKEEARRRAYYDDLYRRRTGALGRIWNWIKAQ